MAFIRWELLCYWGLARRKTNQVNSRHDNGQDEDRYDEKCHAVQRFAGRFFHGQITRRVADWFR